MSMKKAFVIAALFATNIAIAQSPGGGGISAKNVMPELRTRPVRINSIEHKVADEADVDRNGAVLLKTTASAVVGTNGIVMKAATSATMNVTSGFAPPPFPSKLLVFLVDGNSDDTLTCTSIVIYGFDQFGNAIVDNSITSMGEGVATEHHASNKITQKVFEKVTRVTGVCSGGDASDYVVIVGTHIIGLPMKISSVEAVKQICYSRTGTKYSSATASYDNICLVGGSSDSSTAFDNAGASSRIDVLNSSVDLTTSHTTTGTLAVSVPTTVNIYLRARAGSK